MSEHLLPDWLTASFACGNSNFRIPIIRAGSPQERGQARYV